MAFTKINAAGIGTTERVTVDGLTVINNLSVGGTVSIAGTLTYEDVTNVDAVGLITARSGIVVGSGITLSKDGDIFATGITTVSGNVKVGTGITLSPDGHIFTTGISTFGGNIQLSGADPEIELNNGGPRFRVPSANTLTIHTGSGLGSSNEERVRIDSNGRLIIGHTASTGEARFLQVVGTTGDTSSIQLIRHSANASCSQIDLSKSRNATKGSNTIVQDDDVLGQITFRGDDGTDLNSIGASISASVDGTPGSNDMPGRLVFSTTADGSNSATERLRITSGGAVQISGADDQDNLLVKGVGTGFAVHQDDTDGEVSLRAQDVTGSNNAKFMTFFVQKSGESPSEAMRISNTRKVGIATVTPNAQLHILTTNEAGILIEDSSTGNNAPYLEVMAKRTDANIHQSFSGQLLLSRNRTEQKISSGLKLGSILFGGNHTNGSKSNIAFPASIAGISTGNFDDVNNMPTALTFYTGFTGRTRLQANVSSGVERMRISPEGYITKPYQPACTAHQLGSAINTNGEANRTEVVFTQTITNRGSHYNTSNGRFTCPVGGVYHVSAGFLTRKGTATNAYHNVFIYKSGSDTGLKTRDINNANELHITVAGLIDCNAGQYLSVYVSNDGGDFWSDYNYFSVHLVG